MMKKRFKLTILMVLLCVCASLFGCADDSLKDITLIERESFEKTLITAHNGVNGTKDDSMESIEEAIQSGADIIEIDVRQLDGLLYLSHDKVKSAKVPSKVTLAAVFERLKTSNVRVNCDLKENNLMASVLSLAEEMGVKDRILFTGSISKEQVAGADRACAVYVDFGFFGIKDGKDTDLIVREVFAYLSEFNEFGINISYQKLTAALYTACKNNDIKISVYTVDTMEKVRLLQNLQVHNITSRKVNEIHALAR